MAPERWKVGGGGVSNVHRPRCHWVSFVHIHSMVMIVIKILMTLTSSLYMIYTSLFPSRHADGSVRFWFSSSGMIEELLDNNVTQLTSAY